MEWAELGAEMTNKMRWAIGSSLDGVPGINLDYRAQMVLAGALAGDAIKLLKMLDDKPNLRWQNTADVRKLLTT